MTYLKCSLFAAKSTDNEPSGRMESEEDANAVQQQQLVGSKLNLVPKFESRVRLNLELKWFECEGRFEQAIL